ncbi:cysteine proteinase [Phellopilus nigrolimitatus]|nr:cysteine proteinase [Phellopilus nigrolimitatus]
MADENDSSGWQLTESDPGVFTELLKTLGVNLAVDDLYSLDSEALSTLQPIHALIFLFKWVSNQDERGGGSGSYDDAFPGFFAHQVVNNAHGRADAWLAITSSEFLREAHNALSPPSAISLDGLSLPKTSEDAYHFVVFLPVAGSVYELDGLKRNPVRHGTYSESGEGWIAKAREVIEARIATYPPGSLEFNLMAIHDDILPLLQTQLQTFQAAGNDVMAAEFAARISQENEKLSRWAFENSLRRHNHVGLVHALTLALAKAGLLNSVSEQAKTKMKTRIEKREKEGKMDED